MKHTHETYMHRCLHLALQGKGNVEPNPMVGAVLVYEDTIIGEGFHAVYGKEHAEVNCINNVQEQYKHLIAQSTLYVSLEPCAHYGKTPPCAHFIVQHQIPRVVVGVIDYFSEVNGKGIEYLEQNGVDVMVGILLNECTELNKRFFKFEHSHRPYIILKWAQTSNGFIANDTNERLMISNELTNRLVHKWRSEEMAIMVGSNTVLSDNPQLNNRLWTGKQPIRLVLDGQLKMGSNFKVLDGTQPTIVFNYIKTTHIKGVQYHKLNKEESVITQIMQYAKEHKIQSILVEGGAALLQQFINHGTWDEARVITNSSLAVTDGLRAPSLTNARFLHQKQILSDIITYYSSHKNE